MEEVLQQKVWLLYDGRYRIDEWDSVCYEACSSLKEAEKSAGDYGSDTVIVEAERKYNTIVNGKIIN